MSYDSGADLLTPATHGTILDVLAIDGGPKSMHPLVKAGLMALSLWMSVLLGLTIVAKIARSNHGLSARGIVAAIISAIIIYYLAKRSESS